VYSLSEEIEDEAMWAYYGEEHTGLALILNTTPEFVLDIVPPLFPQKIKYSSEPARVKYWEIPPNKFAQACSGTKSNRWKQRSHQIIQIRRSQCIETEMKNRIKLLFKALREIQSSFV
jgi:hypothetical protein